MCTAAVFGDGLLAGWPFEDLAPFDELEAMDRFCGADLEVLDRVLMGRIPVYTVVRPGVLAKKSPSSTKAGLLLACAVSSITPNAAPGSRLRAQRELRAA